MPAARRAAVICARETRGISERRAGSIIGADRSAMRYRHRRADDAALRDRLRQLAAERRRFRYRRLRLLLDREGVRMNHKKLRRLYAEERLQVRRRGGRKRALGTRAGSGAGSSLMLSASRPRSYCAATRECGQRRVRRGLLKDPSETIPKTRKMTLPRTEPARASRAYLDRCTESIRSNWDDNWRAPSIRIRRTQRRP
jgi:hypothetical protein